VIGFRGSSTDVRIIRGSARAISIHRASHAGQSLEYVECGLWLTTTPSEKLIDVHAGPSMMLEKERHAIKPSDCLGEK